MRTTLFERVEIDYDERFILSHHELSYSSLSTEQLIQAAIDLYQINTGKVYTIVATVTMDKMGMKELAVYLKAHEPIIETKPDLGQPQFSDVQPLKKFIARAADGL